MARLSIHILDTFTGTNAAGVKVDFSRREGGSYELLQKIVVSENGQSPAPIFYGDTIPTGHYQLEVYVAEYYASRGLKPQDGATLDKAPIRFSIFDGTQNYHIPVLFSPFGYTTYRGQ